MVAMMMVDNEHVIIRMMPLMLRPTTAITPMVNGSKTTVMTTATNCCTPFLAASGLYGLVRPGDSPKKDPVWPSFNG